MPISAASGRGCLRSEVTSSFDSSTTVSYRSIVKNFLYLLSLKSYSTFSIGLDFPTGAKSLRYSRDNYPETHSSSNYPSKGTSLHYIASFEPSSMIIGWWFGLRVSRSKRKQIEQECYKNCIFHVWALRSFSGRISTKAELFGDNADKAVQSFTLIVKGVYILRGVETRMLHYESEVVLYTLHCCTMQACDYSNCPSTKLNEQSAVINCSICHCLLTVVTCM